MKNRFFQHWSAHQPLGQSWRLLALVGLLVVAAGLRLYQLGELPNGLNRDEASLGYTAYTIQLRGTDERGQAWPLNVKSFGDWKLGGYIYTLVPFVIGFGLQDWVVRLPSALAGIASVYLVYAIVKQLVEEESAGKKTDHFRWQWLPFLTALTLTFSPWHLHVSRVAYESNLALFFLLVGVRYFQLTNPKHPYRALLAAGFFSLTLITYHAYQLFTPLFGLWLIWLYREKVTQIWRQNRLVIAIALVLPLATIGALILNNSSVANTVKFSGLSIFSREHYAPILFEQRQRFPQLLSLLGQGYANTATLFFGQLFANVANISSPTFLFLTGGSHPSHHVPGLGLLHWFELATLIIGGYCFWQERKRWQVLVAGWLLLATLPALITFEATHPIRFLPGIAPLAVISSYGLLQLIKVISGLKHRWVKTGARLGLAGVVLGAYSFAVLTYFVQFPQTSKDTWPWYMEQIVAKVWPIKDQYNLVLMQGESSSPYIYFMYYNQLDPLLVKDQLGYYPEDKEGFEHVQKLSTLYFQTVVWDDLEGHVDKVLFVLRPSEIPGDKLAKPEYKVLDRITDPASKQEFVIFEYVRFR